MTKMSLPIKKDEEAKRGCMPQSIRDEFKVANFGLSKDDPSLFVTSQCGPKLFYRIWTTLWSVYHIIVILLQPYFQWNDGNLPSALWFIYLTNWGYVCLVLFSLVDCITAHYVHMKRKDIVDGMIAKMPWYLKLNWVLFNVSTSIALLITILYYGLLSPDFDPESVLTHMINTVFILANFFVCAKPIRLLHFYQAVIFATIYAVFSVIYQSSGGSAIYPVVDWDKVTSTLPLTLGLLLLAVPTVHVLLYGMYQLRLCVYNRCCAVTKIDPLQLRDKETDILQMRY